MNEVKLASNFDLAWSGYAYQNTSRLPSGYSFSDLSSMSYADMAEMFNGMAAGMSLQHRFDDVNKIAFPVLVS